MRPKLDKVKWKVIHIDIDFIEFEEQSIASSRKLDISSQQFFDNVVDHLTHAGFNPRMSIDRMKEQLKSPYSESEYYTFLKIENSNYVKVVLDIRFSQHVSKEYGNISSRDRHLHYMERVSLKKIAKELNLDLSKASPQFIDISETLGLVSVDGTLFNTYSEALVEVKNKIDAIS